MADTIGRPVRLSVTTGHRHDMLMAPLLLEGSPAQYVLADKAYDSDALLAQIVEQCATAVIAPKSDRNLQRRYDRERYKQRNVVERFSGRIEHYRRIATRYDKTVRNYFTAVTIACILLWL